MSLIICCVMLRKAHWDECIEGHTSACSVMDAELQLTPKISMSTVRGFQIKYPSGQDHELGIRAMHLQCIYSLMSGPVRLCPTLKHKFGQSLNRL